MTCTTRTEVQQLISQARTATSDFCAFHKPLICVRDFFHLPCFPALGYLWEESEFQPVSLTAHNISQTLSVVHCSRGAGYLKGSFKRFHSCCTELHLQRMSLEMMVRTVEKFSSPLEGQLQYSL